MDESGETSHFISKEEPENLSIKKELGVLEKLKETKQQKWREERKQLLSHTQQVITQLQEQIERSNDGQRNA